MRGKQFTDDEKRYILKNYKKNTIHSMKEHLGCTWYKVNGFLESQGLQAKTDKHIKWTKDNKQKLKELAESGKSVKYIAKQFKCTAVAIELAIRKNNIGLVNRYNRIWTKDEEEYLKENWGKVRVEVLSAYLHRKITCLKQRAQELELPTLIENSDIFSISMFCELTNISRDRLSRWIKNGFPIMKHKVSSKKSYYYTETEDALGWMEKHQDEFDASHIEPYSLGYEPLWLQEKRSVDRQHITKIKKKQTIKTNIVDREFWTTGQERKLKELIDSGKSLLEISIAIDKTKESVLGKMRALGLCIAKKYVLSDSDRVFIRDNYLSMSYEEIAIKLNSTDDRIQQCASKQMGIHKHLEIKRIKGLLAAEHETNMNKKQCIYKVSAESLCTRNIRLSRVYKCTYIDPGKCKCKYFKEIGDIK